MRSATVVLPVPGLPVNDMWRDGAPALSPRSRRRLVDQQQRGNVANAALDRREAYQLAIEPLQDLTDVGIPESGVEIESLRLA